jgi:tetratricopeptide (TPR) repeat protein
MQSAMTLRVWFTACGVVAILVGCNRPQTDRESGSVSADSATDAAGASVTTKGKVPVSTKSEEARKLYDEGLALFDQIRFHDARQKFQQAVAKDPDFALAHYQLAITSPTNKETAAHTKQAVALADKASEGERLAILSLQAGVNADPAKSLEYSKEAVQKYPEDERARLNLSFGYSGQQEYEKAVHELNKAIELNPDFSPAYNLLGYAYRPLNKNDEAEKAFKKYIELVPNDPNPYDSYAELLMKTGRFDESVAQYRKALSIDPHFTNAHYGVASNLMFQGKHAEAIKEAQKVADGARNDGDRRFALFIKSVVYADQGNTTQALNETRKQYDLGARIGDTAAMAGDAVSMGNILLNAGRADEARKRFQQALSLQESSGLSPAIKEDARLAHRYHMGRIALAKNDVATAKSEAEQYLKGAEATKNDFRTRQARLLLGKIALKEKKFDDAVGELEQANLQDPGVLYSIALAYQGKGDQAKAAEMFKQAAESYTLPTLSYAFIRAKAKQQSAGESTS